MAEREDSKISWITCPDCGAFSITQKADNTRPFRRLFWYCRWCKYKWEKQRENNQK